MILKLLVAVVKFALASALFTLLCVLFYCGTQCQRATIMLSFLTGGLMVDFLWKQEHRERLRTNRRRRRQRH